MDEGAPGEQAAAQPPTEIPEGTTGEGDSQVGVPSSPAGGRVHVGLCPSPSAAGMWVDTSLWESLVVLSLMPCCFHGWLAACLPENRGPLDSF